MDDAVDPDLIETSVDISRPGDGGVDVLRQFSASIGYSVESGLDEIPPSRRKDACRPPARIAA